MVTRPNYQIWYITLTKKPRLKFTKSKNQLTVNRHHNQTYNLAQS